MIDDISDEELRRLYRAGKLGGTRTVSQACDAWLPLLGDDTRRTYSTHLNLFLNGIRPICDQVCEPCATPVSTCIVDNNGERIGGRRLMFECRCECAKCRSSRISLPALGDEPVNAHTMSFDNAMTVATAALRLGKKRGAFENSARSRSGKPPKNAHGLGAQETAIAALRAFFKAAGSTPGEFDLGTLKKPKRRSRNRRALLDYELIDLCHATETGGNDPELDALLVEYGIATGARRKGALGLTLGALRPRTQMIEVADKYSHSVPMPVSADLIARLAHHAVSRGGSQCDPSSPDYRPNAPVFWMCDRRRGHDYKPLTSRRFDTLMNRWAKTLDWAADEEVGYHHLRHTVSERLKSMYGQHYAQRYLRHADTEVTDRYGRCTDEQLAGAMAQLLGFTHPLVDGVQERRSDTLRRLGLG